MEKLIDLFRIYLVTQNISPTSRKNYLVDFKNFLEWFTLHLKTNQTSYDEEKPQTLGSLVSKDKIELYLRFLVNNETPVKTINRRLSTMRKFGSFATTQGWTNINPAREIVNIGTKPVKPPNPDDLLLYEFKNDLLAEKVSPVTLKNYLVDVRQFLRFINQI